jgi:calcineurin-like phosphoesterase family protein
VSFVSVFFTADQHFGHASIIQHCRRPFADVAEMDAELIRRWNDRVNRQEIVYHLGDFLLCHSHRAEGYLEQLNGVIRIVPGGHDHGWLKYMRRVGREFRSRSGEPVQILPPLAEIKPQLGAEGIAIVVCHYPMLAWEGSHYGSWHLHGHIHGTRNGYHPRALDVGVDCWDYQPVSLQEIAEAIFQKRAEAVSLHDPVSTGAESGRVSQ